MSKLIQELERRIVGVIVSEALAAGYRITVSLERGYDVPRNEVDKSDGALVASRDRAKIMDEAFAGDDAHLFIHEATGPVLEDGCLISKGWIYIVLGNDGWDVVNDYTTNLEPLMVKANDISNQYA